jgi:hypothetical protein
MLFSVPIKGWLRIRKLANEQLLAIYVQFDRGCFAIHHYLPPLNRPSMHCAFDCLEERKSPCHVTIVPGRNANHVRK